MSQTDVEDRKWLTIEIKESIGQFFKSLVFHLNEDPHVFDLLVGVLLVGPIAVLHVLICLVLIVISPITELSYYLVKKCKGLNSEDLRKKLKDLLLSLFILFLCFSMFYTLTVVIFSIVDILYKHL